MYSALYLNHFGMFLLTANWVIGITWLPAFSMILVYRIDREEGMMIAKFGNRKGFTAWQPLCHLPGIRDSSGYRKSGHIPGRAPPIPVLASESQYQCLNFRRKRRSSGRFPVARAVELARHQVCMPTKNGIRFDDRRDALQRLSTEFF